MRDDAAETERQTASEGEDGTGEARDTRLDQIASFAHWFYSLTDMAATGRRSSWSRDKIPDSSNIPSVEIPRYRHTVHEITPEYAVGQ